ncbi:hypothetical protein ACFE04_000113 [Oxalis oulophora]
MAKSSSYLFGGTSFNRKKFAADIARFQDNKDEENSDKTSDYDFLKLLDTRKPKTEADTVLNVNVKKRKRKGKSAASVEGFNVFKGSSKPGEGGVNEVDDRDGDESRISKGRKEANQQMERDAIFRKKHNIHVSGANVPSPLQSFADLTTRFECEPSMLLNFADLKYKEPTPIQRQAIPVLLSGRPCFACAPTGSGKTLAFVCPMLMKLKEPSKEGIRAVILSPTRELAAQTTRVCKSLAKGLKFRIKLMTKQILKAAHFSKFPCDILICTPLRLQKAIQKKKIDLSRVEYLVLDESDKLFELGLLKQIDSVVKACSNPSIIRALFSATLPDFVEELARSVMPDAVRVIIGRKNTASELIKQKLVFTGTEEGKILALRQSFAESLNPPVLIFAQNKARAKELYEEIKFDNIRADVIHSDLTEFQRQTAVENFRAGKTWVLIATDVIARGMDFKGVNCVINYDFPDSASSYIHRIGRSGRAGRSGEAITFYTEEDIPYLRNIANVMTGSGCEVPSFLTTLPKDKKRWKKHCPKRETISSKPKGEK